MTLYDRILDLCEESGIGTTTLEKKIGAANGSIGKIKYRKSVPSSKTLEKIADYFGVTLDYLMHGTEPKRPIVSNIYPIEVTSIPTMRAVSEQRIIYADENRESYIESGTDIHVDFCMHVSNNDMAHAKSGDIAFIQKQPVVENGAIAAVLVDESTVAELKRFYYDQSHNTLNLKVDNPESHDMIFTGTELSRVRVLGKAVAFQIDAQ